MVVTVTDWFLMGATTITEWGPIATAVAAILGSLFAAAVALSNGKRDRGLKVGEVEIAAATAAAGAGGIYDTMFENFQSEVVRLQQGLAEVRAELLEVREDLKQHKRWARKLELYIDDLHENWPIHIRNPRPPARPTP